MFYIFTAARRCYPAGETSSQLLFLLFCTTPVSLSGSYSYLCFAPSKPTMGVQRFIMQKVSLSVLRKSADNNPEVRGLFRFLISTVLSSSAIIYFYPSTFLAPIFLDTPFILKSQSNEGFSIFISII